MGNELYDNENDAIHQLFSEYDQMKEQLKEAQALADAADSWAKSVCEELGLKPARDTVGFRLGEISKWINDHQKQES